MRNLGDFVLSIADRLRRPYRHHHYGGVLQSARNSLPLTDIYGIPYGSIQLAPGVLTTQRSGPPTTEVPPGIPRLT